MKTNLLDRITIEPGKCGGRPCIRGMRISVELILAAPDAGTSHDKKSTNTVIEKTANRIEHLKLPGSPRQARKPYHTPGKMCICGNI